MTINRKEKVLIFILILFLLVGGTFTLGIMPKNNDKKTAQEELQTVQSEIAKVQKQNEAVSPAKFKNQEELNERNLTALKLLTSPGNNIYEELLPSNMPGHEDKQAIEKTIKEFFGELGMHIDFRLDNPVLDSTKSKKTYAIYSEYSVTRSTLYSVVDTIARVKSFNIVQLTVEPTADGKVKGTIGMTITYLLNE